MYLFLLKKGENFITKVADSTEQVKALMPGYKVYHYGDTRNPVNMISYSVERIASIITYSHNNQWCIWI